MYNYASNNWSHWGIVTRNLRNNLEAIPGKHSVRIAATMYSLGTLFVSVIYV
jgi:hypothetical protein